MKMLMFYSRVFESKKKQFQNSVKFSTQRSLILLANQGGDIEFFGHRKFINAMSR